MRVVFRLHKPMEHPRIFKIIRTLILSSGLPFEPAKINQQWPRFAYGPVLPSGMTAAREYVDVYLRSFATAEEVKTKLQQQAGTILTVLQVSRVPYPLPSVQQLAQAANYRISSKLTDWMQTLENYLNASKTEVVWEAPTGLTYAENVKPYVVAARKINEQQYELVLQSVAEKWLNPYALLAASNGKNVPQEELFTVEGFTIEREGLYWQDSQGELHLI